MTPKEVVCSYCKEFNKRGWMPGASGGMALLSEITPHNKSILVTPETINKDSLTMGDLFDLKLEFGTERVVAPTKLTNNEPPEIAGLASSFMSIFQMRPDIKCVIELTSEWFVLASRLAIKLWETKADSFPDELRISNLGLIKYLQKDEVLTIPIVDAVDVESKLSEVVAKHPKIMGLLLRNRGMLVFGKTPEVAKANVEYFDYICRTAVIESRCL